MLESQAEEGEGSGHPSEPQPPPSTAQPTNEEPILNVVSSSYQKTQTPRQALNKVVELPQTSEPIPNALDEGIRAGGSPRCQEAMGGSIAQTRSERVPTPPRDSPLPRVYTLGSDEGSMTLHELTGEDQPEDQLGVLSAAKVLADAAKTNVHTYTRRRMAVSTSIGGISTTGTSMPVSTAGMVQEVNISISSPVVIKDKGNGKMEEYEDEHTKRTKLQQEQERLGHEVVVRLQEELNEEERQRMTKVHEAAQSFTEEEQENIRARVKADEELSKRLQAEKRNKYSEVDQAKMPVDLINQRKKYFVAKKAEVKRNKPMTQAQQRNYMINYIKYMGSHILQQLKRYSFDELKELFEITMKNVNTFVPMETEDKGRASELATGSSQATIIDSAKVGSSKRAEEAELDHEGSKRQKTNEASGDLQRR
ncbi:hypothetical protein Tco_1188223 [Tanacetum coccineum]